MNIIITTIAILFFVSLWGIMTGVTKLGKAISETWGDSPRMT